MAWRESFDVAPMIHQNPIPTASRVGNMLFTSVIGGRDPETGEVPDSAEAQAVNAFKNLDKILTAVGATAGDVAHVTVFIKDNSVRPLVNKPWVEMFPDEHSRPARHAIIDPNLGGMVQIEAVAVIQG
ncbi:MAG: RidA family protein [Dehalococcoidia bacterium]